jgi:small subunit ribosomal protein S9
MADEHEPEQPSEEPQSHEEAPTSEETPAEQAPSKRESVAEAQAHGHAVPSEEATEIASVVEDAPLEALEEAQEAQAETASEEEQPAAESAPEEQPAAELAPKQPAPEPGTTDGEEPVAAEADEEEEAEEPAPREKPAVPGAHLEVDIVPEGVDPLAGDEVEDPYALEEELEPVEEAQEEEREEPLTQPIATAAIDLASGARYRATGKRKTAIARVTLRPGKGTYLVNGRALEEHFPRVTLQRNIRQPLETVGYQERMDVIARLHGGGISAQAGALRHGVSRALLEADPNLRGELKRRGFLTRDSRAKERKKAGLKKARKRPQFSKR